MVDIPQEIAECVVEHCRDSIEDLKTCSLISPAWTPSTRRYLFQTLILGGSRRAVRFRAQSDPLVYRMAVPFLQQYHELDEFLEQRPFIAQRCIRLVRLRFESPTISPATYDAATTDMLGRIFARLTYVQEFDLHLGRWHGYPPKAQGIIYSAIRQHSVSKLSIGSSDLFVFSNVIPLIVHSPGLKCLAIQDIGIFDSDGAVEDTSHLPAISLEYLRIDQHLKYLVPTFLSPGFPLHIDRLHRLRLSLPARLDACELIIKLIGACGASVQHLELTDNAMYRAVPDFFRLQTVPNLRTIDFGSFRATSFHSSIRWIVNLFSNLTVRLPLEKVSISMTTHSKMLDETSVGEAHLWGPLRALDSLLTGPNLPRFHQLHISVTIREPDEFTLQNFNMKLQESFRRLGACSHDSLAISIILTPY